LQLIEDSAQQLDPLRQREAISRDCLFQLGDQRGALGICEIVGRHGRPSLFGRPRQRDNLVIMKTRDMSEYMRAYRAANAEKLREYNRAYRAANREKKREYNRKHRLSNPEAYREYQRQYRRNRYANDPEFRERLKERVRQRARRQAAISSNPSSSRGSVGDEGE
jgi:hypothetical protein